jgi:putative DeoR family transcriptional regulator (stage III sporulation protein D)
MNLEDRVKRIIRHANLILLDGATIRSVGKETNWSKSTVYKDLIEDLPKIDPELSDQVNEKIQKNKQERSIRGGLALKKRLEEEKNGKSRRS